MTVTPPGAATSLWAEAFVLQASSQTQPAQAGLSLSAGHSPSGNFIHVEQAVPGPWKVGDLARFRVHSPSRAVNFYYEVVALQALTQYASAAQADVDARVILKAGDWHKEARVSSQNFDVVQVVEVSVGQELEVLVDGKGEVVGQVVRRFNLPDVEETVTLSVHVTFQSPEQVQAGMVVLDIAVPTGFVPEGDTLEVVARAQPKIKRYDVAGRKVIFYIEDMASGESVSFNFKARALYSVKAQGVASQAYSYYKPGLNGESLGPAVSVSERP